MDTKRLERDVRLLKGYAVVMTLVVTVLVLGGFVQARGRTELGEVQGTKAKFQEIDVERINVIEPDGKYRLVLSNRPRSIGPIYKGQPFGYPGGTRPGMIWFNDEGTENGGFTIRGSRCENGTSVDGGRCTPGTYSASANFTFDQFDQDQIFVMNYSDQNGRRRVGITINDRHEQNIFEYVVKRDSLMALTDTVARNAGLEALRRGAPDNPRVAERLYIGRDVGKRAILDLSDKFGRSRLRLVVDSLGDAHIDFLDEEGRVTNTIGPRSGR